MAIDNPSDKIREIVGEDDKDPLGVSLQIGGLAAPLLAVLGVLKSALSSFECQQRIKAAVLALCYELERVQERWPTDLNAALQSDWFKKAIAALLEESSRAHNEERAVMLGRAAAHGCFPSEKDSHRQEDLATYIHELAQLGSDDIHMLKLLEETFRETIRVLPNLHDPNYFSQHFNDFKTLVQKEKIDPDDAIALGVRLSGFGLAVEVPRNTTHQAPGEYCIRPTKRGLYLLSLLKAAETPIQERN